MKDMEGSGKVKDKVKKTPDQAQGKSRFLVISVMVKKFTREAMVLNRFNKPRKNKSFGYHIVLANT